MTAPVDTAQTYGWDTVFAVHIGNANAAIAAAKSSPLQFSQTDTKDGVCISGQFGDWAIVPGGDGDLVRLALPIRQTTVSGVPGTALLAGTVRVDVRLDLLHDAEVASRKHLKVRTTAVAAGTKVASVVDVVFVGPAPSFMACTVVHALMEDWLNANLVDFDHVFATVDLDHRAASGAFQWMQPTDTSYAYTDLGTATDGALAVLCMTGGRSSAGLIQQVSNTCLPPGQTASLLINKARVMDQVLLPGMPLTFKGSSATNFGLSGTGESIVAQGNPIPFTVSSEGKDYDAVVTDLSVHIDGEELTFDVTTKVTLSPGIWAFTRSINTLNVALGKAKDGGQSLQFNDVHPPVVTRWTASDPGIKIAEEVLAIAALVAAVVATVLTDGAAVGALAIAIGFAAGVMQLTESAIEMAGANGAPSINAAVLDATAAVEWPATSGFVLSTAQLSDSLQLTGAFAT